MYVHIFKFVLFFSTIIHVVKCMNAIYILCNKSNLLYTMLVEVEIPSLADDFKLLMTGITTA